MATSSGSEISELLLERHPELFLLLEYGSEEEEEDLFEEESLFLTKPQELSTVYVYGLGSGACYSSLKPWLKSSSHRRLIIIEESLENLRRVSLSERAFELFSDPQVIVRYLPHQEGRDALIQDLVSTYPCDLVEVVTPYVHKSVRFEEIKLELLRKSTLSHAITTESLHYHKLLRNILANLNSWSESFVANRLKNCFKGIPAIICGAGPSLAQEIPLLQQLEDKALLLAGGSTITALSNNQVMPHLGMAIDPNFEEFERLKQAGAFALPLIYGTRLEKQTLDLFGGEKGYISSDTGGPCEKHFEKIFGLDQETIGPQLGIEALSVTTLLLALAVEMGCDPIFFCGVDLAYQNAQRYAPGVLASPANKEDVRSSERLTQREDIGGKSVSTLVKWVMESECIASFAKNHPKVRFFNASQGGLGFEGIPNCQLEDLVETELTQALDLRALVHAELAQLKWEVPKKAILKEKRALKTSLEKLVQITQEMIEELKDIQAKGNLDLFPSPRLSLLEMDFGQESAFTALNPFIGSCLEKLMRRLPSKESAIRGQIQKFEEWSKLLQEQLVVLASGC